MRYGTIRPYSVEFENDVAVSVHDDHARCPPRVCALVDWNIKARSTEEGVVLETLRLSLNTKLY